MTSYFKILLLMTVAAGMSLAGDARADFRDYNYKAWAQAGRSSRAARTSRPYRATAPVIVRSERAPEAVAQAPSGERRFSYEPAESAEQADTGSRCGCCDTAHKERAPETAQRPAESERRFSYEPSTEPDATQPAVRSDSAPRMQPSRSADRPRYLLPKTDPRKYRN